MLRTVFAKTVWERRKSTMWWTAALVALAGVTVGFVPSIRDNAETFRSLFDTLPEGLLSMFGGDDAATLLTPTGFVNSRLYTGIGPVVIAVLGAGMGTAAIVGEEERGTLDLLLAQPILRRRMILEKTLAAIVVVIVVVTALFITLLVGNPMVDLRFGVEQMAAANVGLGLAALVFYGLALLVGSITGRRGVTVGVSAGFIGGGFFVNGLAPLVDQLAWLQRLTPFFWLQEPNPLANGFAWGWFALMALAATVLIAGAVVAFDRRDIGV